MFLFVVYRLVFFKGSEVVMTFFRWEERVLNLFFLKVLFVIMKIISIFFRGEMYRISEEILDSDGFSDFVGSVFVY